MNREHQVLATFDRLREALVGNDVETLDALLAPEYCGFDPGGHPQDRAMTLDAYRPGMTRLSCYEVADLQVLLIGEAAVITGIGTIAGAFGEWEFAHRLRFVDIYRATPAGWRLSLSTSTPVQDALTS